MADVRVKTGPGRPAGIDSVETRQRVIEAACACFAQYGYGPATNSQIAQLAGVTAGSVHYHFGLKHKLFEAVCEDVFGRLTARTRDVISTPLSMPDILRAVLTESMRINHESPELAAFFATAPIDARRHPELSEAFAKQGSRMAETISLAVRRGQEHGLISDGLDVGEVAGVIVAVINGFAHTAAEVTPDHLDAINDAFSKLLLDPAARPR